MHKIKAVGAPQMETIASPCQLASITEATSASEDRVSRSPQSKERAVPPVTLPGW